MSENIPQGTGGETPSQQPATEAPEHKAHTEHTAETANGAKDMKAEAKNLVGKLEALLDRYMVKDAPFTLPLGLKEFIVTASPYLIIIVALMMLPVIAGVIGVATLSAPFAMMSGYGFGFSAIITLIAALIALVLQVMAIKGLFKRAHSAWRLVFYASIVSFVGSILALNIIGGIVSAIISWYILFQVKEFYKE